MFAKLSELMTAGVDDSAPVAFGAGRVHTRRDFLARAAGLRARLGGGGRWLLATRSPYAFAVGLAALWQDGGTAVLPPNLKPGGLVWDAPDFAGAISDFLGGAALDPLAEEGAPEGFRKLDRAAPAVELMTSGSTGERKTVLKTVAQVSDEADMLEDALGAGLGGCAVYGTVSHQHIFGFYFRVIWPLCAGRPFCDETPLLWEELGHLMRARTPSVLATSPAHLDRIGGVRPEVLAGLGCRRVFSSGGVLRAGAAAAVRAALGSAPVDVYGSTETGGLASRTRTGDPADELWTPFPGVAVAPGPDGRLRARSRLIAPGDLGPGGDFAMGDLGTGAEGGRFSVGPRADRIVKVNELRIALPEVEALLEESPLARRAAVAALKAGDGRDILGAAVVLGSEGLALLEEKGRAGVAAAFKGLLRARLDDAAVPRKWRFPAGLPMDSQGKIEAAALAALFPEAEENGQAGPEVIERGPVANGIRVRMRVPEGLLCLDGHFPGNPVVPGVAQLGWALDEAISLFQGGVVPARLEAVKFISPLRPGEEFVLEVFRAGDAGEKAGFTLASPDGKTAYASGRAVMTT